MSNEVRPSAFNSLLGGIVDEDGKSALPEPWKSKADENSAEQDAESRMEVCRNTCVLSGRTGLPRETDPAVY